MEIYDSHKKKLHHKYDDPELFLACLYSRKYGFSRKGLSQAHFSHDDVMKMETFSALLDFVRGIHRLLVNSPHKSQWRGALMFSLICAWINGWVNNRGAGDLRRHRAHYDVNVMLKWYILNKFKLSSNYGCFLNDVLLWVKSWLDRGIWASYP